MRSHQDRAIEKTEGPCLIMAGAGTGKTYTIRKKIKHLVENEICRPEDILCLTFSNEAAGNLKDKIEQDGVENASEITIRTFHGFCADILKEYGHIIGIDPEFSILLPDDAKVVMHKYIGLSPVDSNRYISSISKAMDLGIKRQDIQRHVSGLGKNIGDCKDLKKRMDSTMFELSRLHLRDDDTKDERKNTRELKRRLKQELKALQEYDRFERFCDAWKNYESYKQENDLLDYSDLNTKVIELMESLGPEELSRRFSHIIVDEFQDTSKQQFRLLEMIASENRNITVVGDPNQSIYGFRGAYKESFDHFKNIFGVDSDKDIFMLDKSYRSPDTVLDISYDLILNNYDEKDDCIRIKNAGGKKGKPVKVMDLPGRWDEACRIADVIEREISKGTPLDEICVLYRTHKQGKIIQKAIESRSISTVYAGRTDLMQTPEIRTVISYLSMISNLRKRTGTGEQAWWNLLHYKNSLSPRDSVIIGRKLKEMRKEGISIDELLLNGLDDLDISASSKRKIENIISKLRKMISSDKKSLPDLVLDIYEITGLNKAFSNVRSNREKEALMNLNRFHEIAEDYYRRHDRDLSSFIEYLEMLDELGVNIDASSIKEPNAVRLMTIHAVKGLQFDTVIVSYLAKDRFPLERTRRDPLIPYGLMQDLQKYLEEQGDMDEKERDRAIRQYEKACLMYEERRLCYVAFTRAKRQLVLTYARSYDGTDDSSGPSRFLEDIDFRKNESIVFEEQGQATNTDHEKSPESSVTGTSMLQRMRRSLTEAIETEDLEDISTRLVSFLSLRDGKIPDPSSLDLNAHIDRKEIEQMIIEQKENIPSASFEPSNFTFSPTALLDYSDCPKKYEMKHIFQMPERGMDKWDSASTGSFVHRLFEIGVTEGFKTKQEFTDMSREMAKRSEWDGIDLDDVDYLIGIFWERHQGRYDERTLVEQKMPMNLGGFRFFGIADRIDFISGNDVEIIDYKTNRNMIPPKKRAWQLGFYAIAARKVLGVNPRKLTLEMLRLEKPVETEVDDNGDVKAGRSKGFNIDEVEKELLECARSIMKDYETGFTPTEDDNTCSLCGYRFYCPRWEES